MKKVLFVAMGSFVFWSCNNPSETTSANQEVTTQEEHHHNESSDALELNNGEKWIVNEEMKPFVRKGEELVNNYIQTNQSDYKQLAQQVNDQNQQLITSCTMDGKSHDELHKWLHPHLALVKDLENETDAAKAKGIVDQLQQSYKTYHEYFQ